MGKKLKFIFYECYFSFIDFKKDINALKIRNVVDIHMYISQIGHGIHTISNIFAYVHWTKVYPVYCFC